MAILAPDALHERYDTDSSGVDQGKPPQIHDAALA